MSDRSSNEQATCYRLEVGRTHGIEPGNIVGALSNEGRIDSRQIGRINIFEHFSLVDLLTPIDAAQLKRIRDININQHPLLISLDTKGQTQQDKHTRTNRGKRIAGKGRSPAPKKATPRSRNPKRN